MEDSFRVERWSLQILVKDPSTLFFRIAELKAEASVSLHIWLRIEDSLLKQDTVDPTIFYSFVMKVAVL